MLSVVALVLASAAPHVVHFPGGEALITKAAAAQHVVIKDRSGNITSESDCDADSGSYDEIVAFGHALKSAALRGDRRAIAGMMRYPLRVNTGPGRRVVIPNEAAFLQRYRTLFGPALTPELERLQPDNVFCREGMAMIGNGFVWAQVRNGVLRGIVVNAGSTVTRAFP